MRYYTKLASPPPETLKSAIAVVGGRLSYLNRIARSRDMLEMARHMLYVEKGWLLSQIGLIDDCDDDVMDEVRIYIYVYLVVGWFGIQADAGYSKNGARAHGCCCASSSR